MIVQLHWIMMHNIEQSSLKKNRIILEKSLNFIVDCCQEGRYVKRRDSALGTRTTKKRNVRQNGAKSRCRFSMIFGSF
jgi:hypothetical protein